MATCTQNFLSQTIGFNRIDAEFYKPQNQFLFDKLNRQTYQKLNRLAFITDGIHASPEVVDEGVRYISAKCVKDNYWVLDNCISISNNQNHANPRTQLQVNDVIISTVGTIGNVAVVDNDVVPCNCDRHVGIVRIRDKGNLSPFYLSSFLNSKYGYFQSIREAAGNVQLNLYIRNIGNILVPRLGNQESKIAKLTQDGYTARKQSQSLYTQAQQLLEQELGLDKLTFEKPVGYEARFSEVSCALRNDAEFYNPYAKKISERIQTYENRKLGLDFLIKNGFPWQSAMFLDNNSGEPVVRIRDIRPGAIEVENLTSIIPSYAQSNSFPKANKGDIVIGMDGLKYFYASILEESCYVNQRVAHLTKKSGGIISPEYATFIINSAIGQAQLLRDMTVATTVGHITNMNIRNLVIPYPSKSFHDKISTLVRDSIDKKKESKALLEQAKSRVESLIEKAAVQ